MVKVGHAGLANSRLYVDCRYKSFKKFPYMPICLDISFRSEPAMAAMCHCVQLVGHMDSVELPVKPLRL